MANFNKDHIRSEKNTRHPAWEAAYKQFFAPLDIVKIEKVDDRKLQSLGNDKIIYLSNGEKYSIEEKFNPEAYPRLPIELRHTWNHDGSLKKIGWPFMQLQCDYVAFMFKDTLEFFFFDFPSLQQQVKENHESWERLGINRQNKFWHTLEKHPKEGYTTHMVYVPIVLLQQLIPSMQKIVVSNV